MSTRPDAFADLNRFEEPDEFQTLRLFLPPVEIPERVHDDQHILLWQVRGTGTDLVLDNEASFLPVGHAVWIPSFVRHSLTVRANSVVLPLFFDSDEVATTLDQPVMVAVDRELRTLFLAHLQATTSILQPQVNVTRQLLSRLEGRPDRHSTLRMPSSSPALLVAERLRSNPGDERGIDDLARAVHVSRRTLERMFVAETGLTLRAWRLTNRMEAAALLLRSSGSLPAVAHRVGYTNLNAFRRAFKERFGMTPTERLAHYGRRE